LQVREAFHCPESAGLAAQGKPKCEVINVGLLFGRWVDDLPAGICGRLTTPGLNDIMMDVL
jgi:hypothetical protein